MAGDSYLMVGLNQFSYADTDDATDYYFIL